MSNAQTRFGRYLLLSSLGHGGMAEVFLARDHAMPGGDRLVVIKRILPHLARNPDFVRMFLDEARVNLRMSHPSIAYTFEVGQVESDYFIAMEFVHGESLRRLLSRHDPAAFTPSLACLIASRVAGALHHAHELTDTEGRPLPVVHRDLNPRNIRISYEGAVKVLDFGIARADPQRTEDDTGRFGYLSPEQVARGRLDPRSDIYSLGVVLHEMLTGRRFSGGSTAAPPSQVADHRIPAEIDAIVMTSLATGRDERFPSARAMQEALDGVLRRQPANDTDLRQLMVALFGETMSRKSQFLESLKRRVSGEYRSIDFAQLETTRETFLGADPRSTTPAAPFPALAVEPAPAAADAEPAPAVHPEPAPHGKTAPLLLGAALIVVAVVVSLLCARC